VLNSIEEAQQMDSAYTVPAGDIYGYRARSILMAKILFDRENSMDIRMISGVPLWGVILDYCVSSGLSTEYR
jgi:hypothetical protein